MRIITPESKYWEIAAEHGLMRDDVRRAVRAGALAAARKLPPVSRYLTIMVSPDEPENVIADTGVGAITFTEEYISIVFDYRVPFGVKSALTHLRSTAGHELVHAASYLNAEAYKTAPLQAVVYEGLATVFEKRHGGMPLWGEYEDDATMQAWLLEIREQPEDHKNYEYLFEHPDGRRWIIYKTGGWMVEKLIAAGADLNELIATPYEEVLEQFDATVY